MNFASDNAGPVHPRVMQALMAANEGHAMAYGADPWTARAVARVREVFEAPRAEVLLVPGGIAANALALATLVRPWQRVFCSDIAHIQVDEAGAVALATGGALNALVPAPDGRMSAAALDAAIRAVPAAERGAVSVTQVTEAGSVYPLAHLRTLTEVARAHDLPVHMDGARWANAIATLGCSPADMTWRAGVDALSLGGTKNGLMGAEAVVLFDPSRAAEAGMRRLRMGLTLSKQRFLAAQIEALLTDGLWLEMASAANAAAARLAAGLAAHPMVEMAYPAEANMIYIRAPRDWHRALQATGAIYRIEETPEGTLGAGPEDQRLKARFVCDWSADTSRIDTLLSHLPT